MIQTVQHDLASAVRIIGLCSVTILALSDPALRGQEEHKIHQAILANTKALNVEENDDFDEQLSAPTHGVLEKIGNEEDSTDAVMGGGYDLDNTMIMVEPVIFQQPSSVEPRGRLINLLLHNQAPLLVRISTLQLNTLVHVERSST
ncbi:hypothetical protein EV359DRAFT_85646 [Lentinula novae-zelandiae]|nr:hypothetical protein EV359DRAFT_85646 [Lentinula novae-zelandiae]